MTPSIWPRMRPPAIEKPNCAAVRRCVAQVEPRGAQPADRERLELVAGVEDAQDRAVEVVAVVLRRMGDLVDQLAGAGLADPAAAEVVPRTLPPVTLDQSSVDQRIDVLADSRDGMTAP